MKIKHKEIDKSDYTNNNKLSWDNINTINESPPNELTTYNPVSHPGKELIFFMYKDFLQINYPIGK